MFFHFISLSLFFLIIASVCFKVLLDKPVFIGQAVLDLSKLIMYQLRYEQLPKYEQEFGGRIRVLAGDTDSFFLCVQGEDLCRELRPAMLRDALLDSSNYPPEHPLFSTRNKAKLGCVKGRCIKILFFYLMKM